MQTLRYIPRNEIDISKWDHCINTAPNGLVYAYSYYLDHMARNWDALVLEDYQAVCPVTWNRKFGIRYLHQPPFCAALGVFGANLTESILQAFVQHLVAANRVVEIDMNFGNILLYPPVFSIVRNNYVLNLSKSYEEICGQYRENIKRNIRKSQQLNCRYQTDIDVDEVIRLARMQAQNNPDATVADFRRFRELFDFMHAKGTAVCCGVYNQSNELVSSCVYFFSHNRAYYILVGNHPSGKTMGASHYLIDRFIHEHAGKEMYLDFEGSDIRNLAFFYSSFGASVERYPALRMNRLPWWIRWLKRS